MLKKLLFALPLASMLFLVGCNSCNTCTDNTCDTCTGAVVAAAPAVAPAAAAQEAPAVAAKPAAPESVEIAKSMTEEEFMALASSGKVTVVDSTPASKPAPAPVAPALPVVKETPKVEVPVAAPVAKTPATPTISPEQLPDGWQYLSEEDLAGGRLNSQRTELYASK